MKLVSLKTFKIRADVTDNIKIDNLTESVLTFGSLELIRWILSSSSSLPKLTSIHMELHIEITTSLLKDFDIRRMLWGIVDRELDQPGFAALRNISLRIEKHHFDKSPVPTSYKDEGSTALLSSILPHACGRQSLAVAFEVGSVFYSEPLSLWAYYRSL